MKKKTKSKDNIQFVFFGTPTLSVIVLDELKNAGMLPALVITAPDRPAGRGLKITPPPVKVWALTHNIPLLQPEKLDADFLSELQTTQYDVFIVAAYGKILPKELLDIPKHGALNVHPSLLPKFRGASPIVSAILEDSKETGISIMSLDEEMDHGPIVAQKKIALADWPPRASELGETLAHEGGKLLATVLPHWVASEIEAKEQNHDVATYCKKITKVDGLINLNDNVYKNLLKIRALEGWPGTYTFFERNGKKIRVGIIGAHIENENLIISRVKAEGKREMPYEEFLRSGAVVPSRA